MHYEIPFCPQCGSACGKGTCKDCGVPAAYDPPGAFICMAQTVIVACRFCGDSVPLSGPVSSFECGGCRKTDSIGAQEWAELLVTSARGFEEQGSRFSFERKRVRAPQCQGCGAWYPIATMPLGTSATAQCTCGRHLQGSPPPPWLLQELPCVRGIYNELDVAGPSGREPVMMVCPKCGGGLELNESSERVTRCAYCSTNVFLPAELWERFHPKKAAVRWVLVFVAPMMTAGELASGVEIMRLRDL